MGFSSAHCILTSRANKCTVAVQIAVIQIWRISILLNIISKIKLKKQNDIIYFYFATLKSSPWVWQVTTDKTSANTNSHDLNTDVILIVEADVLYLQPTKLCKHIFLTYHIYLRCMMCVIKFILCLNWTALLAILIFTKDINSFLSFDKLISLITALQNAILSYLTPSEPCSHLTWIIERSGRIWYTIRFNITILKGFLCHVFIVLFVFHRWNLKSPIANSTSIF